MSHKTKALAALQEYDITVTARHMSITDAMKQYAIDKLSKIDRYHTRIAEVAVTIDMQREQNKVDVVLKVNNFKVKAHASTNDMYASIDLVVHKIQSQIRRYKTRLAEHQAKGLKEIDMTVNVVRPAKDELKEVNEDIEEETNRRLENNYRPHEIKKEMRSLKILTLDEAVMKMELSGDQFLVFKRQEDMKINVIYRRSDGDYGVMEPG